MSDPYQSGALTRQPFSKDNASVTKPLFCACTNNPLGAYASQPFCHGQTQPPSAARALAATQPVDGGAGGRVATLRSPQQIAALGPEIYQGHYGMAYKLRFPDYGGALYQYEQCRLQDGTFVPCDAAAAATPGACGCHLRKQYQPTMPEFNTNAGYLDPNARFVIMGSRTNPYFRVFNAPQQQ